MSPWSRAIGGLNPAVFTASLSHASAQPVTVHYLILHDTAIPFLDYIPFNLDSLNTVVIPPLSLSAEIPVRIVGDQRREKDEKFKVVIFHLVNGTIGDGTGIGTIVDDDGRSHTTTTTGSNLQQQ